MNDVDVTEHGATGNDSTDDTAAIEAALSASLASKLVTA